MGGTRGAQRYDADSLELDFSAAGVLNSTVLSILPNRDIEFYFDVASFNLRDQVRNNSKMPLQFTDEPADCRIFYTASTYNNYTALWQYAADAIWTTPALCVPDPANSTASAILAGFDARRDLEVRGLDEDYVGPGIGTTCDPNFPKYCRELICVKSPRCRSGTFDKNAYQCQLPCNAAQSDRCPPDYQGCFLPGRDACNSGSCNYCPQTKPLTRESCRATYTSRHKNGVPNGPINIPGLV